LIVTPLLDISLHISLSKRSFLHFAPVPSSLAFTTSPFADAFVAAVRSPTSTTRGRREPETRPFVCRRVGSASCQPSYSFRFCARGGVANSDRTRPCKHLGDDEDPQDSNSRSSALQLRQGAASPPSWPACPGTWFRAPPPAALMPASRHPRPSPSDAIRVVLVVPTGCHPRTCSHGAFSTGRPHPENRRLDDGPMSDRIKPALVWATINVVHARRRSLTLALRERSPVVRNAGDGSSPRIFPPWANTVFSDSFGPEGNARAPEQDFRVAHVEISPLNTGGRGECHCPLAASPLPYPQPTSFGAPRARDSFSLPGLRAGATARRAPAPCDARCGGLLANRQSYCTVHSRRLAASHGVPNPPPTRGSSPAGSSALALVVCPDYHRPHNLPRSYAVPCRRVPRLDYLVASVSPRSTSWCVHTPVGPDTARRHRRPGKKKKKKKKKRPRVYLAGPGLPTTGPNCPSWSQVRTTSRFITDWAGRRQRAPRS